MDRTTLRTIALVVTIVYGVGFAVLGDDGRQAYAVIGALVVALAWILVARIGRDGDVVR